MGSQKIHTSAYIFLSFDAQTLTGASSAGPARSNGGARRFSLTHRQEVGLSRLGPIQALATLMWLRLVE